MHFLTNFYPFYQDFVNKKSILLSRWFAETQTQISVLANFTYFVISNICIMSIFIETNFEGVISYFMLC